eukprot:625539-Pyramimonas_sp.AAC.2
MTGVVALRVSDSSVGAPLAIGSYTEYILPRLLRLVAAGGGDGRGGRASGGNARRVPPQVHAHAGAKPTPKP